MISYNTLIVLIGTSLLGASSGLIGAYAVLRQRSLTGDALAHAALPGLCIAFLIVGQRSLPAMLFGAFLSGIAGIGVISGLRHWTRIKEDAAIGIVLSVFFGAGVVLSRLIQNRSDVGSKAGLESYILGKTAGMIAQDVYFIGGLSLGCLVIILLLYKEFQLVAFDPAFARVQGWPAFLIDLLMMTLIAVAVVIGLPAVGVVLMAALLIIPGAAARFWTERLGRMLLLSAAFGLSIGILGTFLSARYSMMPAGPLIVVVGTVFFLVSLLFAPRRGMIARSMQERRFRRQLGVRRLLQVFYEFIEPTLPDSTVVAYEDLFSRTFRTERELNSLLKALEADCLIEETERRRYRLTAEGLRRAAVEVRDQRLWDLLLREHPEHAVEIAHFDTDHFSKSLPASIVNQLENELKERGIYPQVLLGGRGED